MNTITKIQEYLLSMKDEAYREFTLPLIPNIDKESVIGVRIPIIKKYAKSLDDESKLEFLNTLPHKYHEEYILHASLLSNIKDYDTFIKYVDKFLLFVSNWSVCDTICNKYLNKYKDKLIIEVYKWLKSDQIYKVRYAVKCLMSYYLGEDFNKEHLEKVEEVKLDDYYVKMMIDWYLATGLAKNYNDFIKEIENHRFNNFIHNKAIQKANESYRIGDKEKSYLKTLKV